MGMVLYSSPKASQKGCSICCLLTPLEIRQQPWPLCCVPIRVEKMQSYGGSKQLSWRGQEWTLVSWLPKQQVQESIRSRYTAVAMLCM